MNIKKWFWKKVAEFKYRKIPYGETCCCGAGMNSHSIWDNHSPRDAKEYAVTSFVESKINTNN